MLKNYISLIIANFKFPGLIFIIFITMIVLFNNVLNNKTGIKKINISEFRNSIILDFSRTNIKVVGWDKDYIQIRYNNSFIDDKTPSIVKSDNKIKLADYKKPKNILYHINTFRFNKNENIFSHVDFEIHVPNTKDLVIYANYIRGLNCRIKGIEVTSTYLKGCSMIDACECNGDRMFLKRCSVSKDYSFNFSHTYIHDSSIKF